MIAHLVLEALGLSLPALQSVQVVSMGQSSQMPETMLGLESRVIQN